MSRISDVCNLNSDRRLKLCLWLEESPESGDGSSVGWFASRTAKKRSKLTSCADTQQGCHRHLVISSRKQKHQSKIRLWEKEIVLKHSSNTHTRNRWGGRGKCGCKQQVSQNCYASLKHAYNQLVRTLPHRLPIRRTRFNNGTDAAIEAETFNLQVE
eukprot:4720326-Pleurochrysis_carterae.AAC.7